MVLNWLDYAVIAVYLFGIVTFGSWFARFQKTTRDYFLTGRSVPWWAICFTIVATETSTLSFIGVPAGAYAGNLSVAGDSPKQRNAFLSVAGAIARAGCPDKPVKQASPTAPKSPSLSAAGASGANAGASTVCLAYVKDRDAARDAMITVFAAVGDEDPLVQEYRRLLSAALF